MEIAAANIVRSDAGHDKGKLFVVLAAEGDEQTCFDLCYTFRMYCRKNAVKKAVRMIQGR